MINDSVNPQLDAEVANLTDALLAGRTLSASTEAQGYTPILRALQQASVPVQPGAAFHAHLLERLSHEFDSRYRQARLGSRGWRQRQWAMAAAALVIVIGGLTVLASLNGVLPSAMSATALSDGNATTLPIIGLVTLLLIVVGLILWRRERK